MSTATVVMSVHLAAKMYAPPGRRKKTNRNEQSRPLGPVKIELFNWSVGVPFCFPGVSSETETPACAQWLQALFETYLMASAGRVDLC